MFLIKSRLIDKGFMDYNFGHRRKFSDDEIKLLKLTVETDPDRHVEKKGADSHIKFHGDQLDFLTKNISFRMKAKPTISKKMNQQHSAKIHKLEKMNKKHEKQLDLAKSGIKNFNAKFSKVKNHLTPKSKVRNQADAHIKKLIKRKDEIRGKISNTKKEIKTLKKDFKIKKIESKRTRDLKIDKTLKDRNNTALRKLQKKIQKTLKETFSKKKSRPLSRKMTNSFGDEKRGHRHHLHPNQKLSIIVPDKIKIKSYKHKKIDNPAHKTFHSHEKTRMKKMKRMRRSGRRFNMKQDQKRLKTKLRKHSVDEIIKSLKLPEFIEKELKLPDRKKSKTSSNTQNKSNGKNKKANPKNPKKGRNKRELFNAPEPPRTIKIPNMSGGFWGRRGTTTIPNPAWQVWKQAQTMKKKLEADKKKQKTQWKKNEEMRKAAAKRAQEAAKRAREAAAKAAAKAAKRAREAAAKAAKKAKAAEPPKKAKDWNKPPPKFIIGWGGKKTISPAYNGWLMRQNMMKNAVRIHKKAADEKAKKAREATVAKKAAEKAAKAAKKATPIKRRVIKDPHNRGTVTTKKVNKITQKKVTNPKATALKALFKAFHDEIDHFRK